jgi:hypothetical protein
MNYDILHYDNANNTFKRSYIENLKQNLSTSISNSTTLVVPKKSKKPKAVKITNVNKKLLKIQ